MARFSFYNPHENSSRALVVAVETPSAACDFTTQESLSELSHLAETLNITTVGKLVQKLMHLFIQPILVQENYSSLNIWQNH